MPGLYYIFAKIQEGKALIRDEDENPLTEAFVESQEDASLAQQIKNILKRFRSIKK